MKLLLINNFKNKNYAVFVNDCVLMELKGIIEESEILKFEKKKKFFFFIMTILIECLKYNYL